jgi:hypothetical protein
MTPFMPTVTLSPDALVRIEGGEVVTWAECERRLAARTPAPEGEVVAWRLRRVGVVRWNLWDLDPRVDTPAYADAAEWEVQPLYASPVVPVGVAKDQEATVVNALIAFANAVEGQSRSRRMDLTCKHTKALVAALGTKDQGSRSKASVPTEGDQAVVLDRVQWLCEGAQPSDYAKTVAAIREAVSPVSHIEALRVMTAAYRNAVLLTPDDALERAVESAEAIIASYTGDAE